MSFINQTPIEIVQTINGITRHASIALLGYANLGSEYPADNYIMGAIHTLSRRMSARHQHAKVTLTQWQERWEVPSLTAEERWLFEQEERPQLPPNFPIETLALLVNARQLELIPQIEMVVQILNDEDIPAQDLDEHFLQLHRFCSKLMTFSRWVSDYVNAMAGEQIISRDNILSSDHTPDMILFHVIRECRSPMTALIGYADMLLSLHAFTDEQRNSIVEKINGCCQTILERSRAVAGYIETWLEETNQESLTQQVDLVFGDVMRFPQFYAELVNSTYLAFIVDIQAQSEALYDDPHDMMLLKQLFEHAQFVNKILRHSYDFFR